ncbi:MAG: hypothetical protein ACI9FU_000515 [Granulosicoccus sp.]
MIWPKGNCRHPSKPSSISINTDSIFPLYLINDPVSGDNHIILAMPVKPE